MRTVIITVHNNQKLALFVEKHKRHFELWLAGSMKGRQMLLDHHMTHDDLEAHLEYAHPGDLVWRDASRLDIPVEKHLNAVEMEETIKHGVFWDYNDPQIDELESLARQASGLPARPRQSAGSVASHLSSIVFLITDKKETNKAKRSMLGQWTDDTVTLNLGLDHKLGWSCTDRKHPLNIGEQVHNRAPDWWNFAMWQLTLMNNEQKSGTHVGVLRVDDQELHIYSNHPHRLAHVFHRGKAVARLTSNVVS